MGERVRVCEWSGEPSGRECGDGGHSWGQGRRRGTMVRRAARESDDKQGQGRSFREGKVKRESRGREGDDGEVGRC